MNKKCIIVLSFAVFLAGLVKGQVINIPADQPTIQAGINAASNGDTVLVAEGTYVENIDFNSKVLTVASQFIMDGDTSHISKTIIDGSDPSDPLKASVVAITNVPVSRATLSGFTITGGSGTYFNPATATYGGGIFIIGCGAIIENNIVKNNTIDKPNCSVGGIVAILSENDTLLIQHNSVIENEVISSYLTAGAIGFIAAKNATVRINDNTILNNVATCSADYKATGGGLYIETEYSYAADIQVFNNLISNNEIHCLSSMGGGIYVCYNNGSVTPLKSAQVKIFNNIISNNYAEDKGGGIGIWNMAKFNHTTLNFPPDPVLINNTITNNIASDGSGIFNYDATTIAINNILWDSITSESCREIFQDSLVDYDFSPDPYWPVLPNRGILHLYNNCIKGGWMPGWEEEWQGTWEGEGNIDTDPWYEDNSFNLSDSSYCVGNGKDSVRIDGAWYAIPELDAGDGPRPYTIDEYPDIGALESTYLKNDLPVGNPPELEQNEILKVYPNPTRDKVNLVIDEPGRYTLEIISISGQLIHREAFMDREHLADLTSFTNGMYYFRVWSDANLWTGKVVKY